MGFFLVLFVILFLVVAVMSIFRLANIGKPKE